MKEPTPFRNEHGAALIISLMFVAVLAMLGATAMVLTSTDMQIGTNYRASTKAFFDADAGVNYAIGKMEAGLSNSSFSLPSTVGGTSTLSYSVPTGFSFTISTITKVAEDAYRFTASGSGPSNSTTSMNVTFTRKSAINFAAFGDSKLDTKNGGSTLSYDSSSSDPTANDPTDGSFQTTHEADVGSNDWLVSHDGANIDGDGVFGEQDDGSPTTDGLNSKTNFYGTAPTNAGRIDPDPLGVATTGSAYNPDTYSITNDNEDDDLVEPDGALDSDTISLGSGETLTLIGKSTIGKPRGSKFYVTSVTLNNGSTLIINVANGPVNLFLSGGFDAKNGSNILVEKDYTDPAAIDEIPSYDSTGFSIFSNSSTKIDLKHDTAFTGLIYAPLAPVDVKNDGDVYGAIRGDNVDIKNGGNVYFDTAIKDEHMSNDLSVIALENVRN